jgi:steroid delta-isomerase-like uncharacterized protein
MIGLLGCRSADRETTSDKALNEQSVLNYMEAGWNAGNNPELRELLSEDYVRYLNGLQVANGVLEAEAYIQNYLNAFPNLSVTVGTMVESELQVAAFWTFEGTNTGEFGEYLPTGKKARVSGASLFTFNKDGRIQREDTFYNELYLLQQLGYTLIPPNLE